MEDLNEMQLKDLGQRLFSAPIKKEVFWYDGPLAYTVETDGKTWLANMADFDRAKREHTYMFFADRDGLVDKVADSKMPIRDFCRQIGRAVVVTGTWGQEVKSVEVKAFADLDRMSFVPDDEKITFEGEMP